MADTDNPTSGDQEPTQKLSPFETMVLGRFDDLTLTLARFEHDTNVRLGKLEAKSYDTKPIWEQALAEILEVKAEIVEVKAEIMEVKAEVLEMKARVSAIEAHLHDIDHTLVGMFATLTKFDERIASIESVN